jgi:hypothetical protein
LLEWTHAHTQATVSVTYSRNSKKNFWFRSPT